MMKDTGVTRPLTPEWVTQQNLRSPSRTHLHDATESTWREKSKLKQRLTQDFLITFLITTIPVNKPHVLMTSLIPICFCRTTIDKKPTENCLYPWKKMLSFSIFSVFSRSLFIAAVMTHIPIRSMIIQQMSSPTPNFQSAPSTLQRCVNSLITWTCLYWEESPCKKLPYYVKHCCSRSQQSFHISIISPSDCKLCVWLLFFTVAHHR